MEKSEIDALVDAATARLAEKAAAEAAETAKFEAVKAAAVEDYKKTLEPAWKGGFAAPKLVGKSSKNEATDAFLHYMRTGDAVAIKAMSAKATMVEGNDSLGGVLVPDDFYAKIIGIRNQRSWVRNAGLHILQTSRSAVVFPVETTAMTEFVYTAEAAAYDENEPIIAPVTVTVDKFTKMIKISEELLADQQADLESFLSQELAEKMALTEAHLIATGTGSNQPYGIFAGGSDSIDSAVFQAFSDTEQTVTFGSAGQIEPDELVSLFYTPSDAYAENAVWLMNRQTLGYLRGLTSSAFASFPGGQPTMTTSAGGAVVETLLGRPVYTNSNIPKFDIALFDPSCYMMVENGGLWVRRLNELYAANGIVGIRASFRFGGAPVNAGGFFYGMHA